MIMEGNFGFTAHQLSLEYDQELSPPSVCLGPIQEDWGLDLDEGASSYQSTENLESDDYDNWQHDFLGQSLLNHALTDGPIGCGVIMYTLQEQHGVDELPDWLQLIEDHFTVASPPHESKKTGLDTVTTTDGRDIISTASANPEIIDLTMEDDEPDTSKRRRSEAGGSRKRKKVNHRRDPESLMSSDVALTYGNRANLRLQALRLCFDEACWFKEFRWDRRDRLWKEYEGLVVDWKEEPLVWELCENCPSEICHDNIWARLSLTMLVNGEGVEIELSGGSEAFKTGVDAITGSSFRLSKADIERLVLHPEKSIRVDCGAF